MYSLRNLLAAVAVDFSPIPVGLWGILTINTDSWVHGDGTSARKQPGIATKATDRLEALAQATGGAAGQSLAGSWEPMALPARAASYPPVSGLSGEPSCSDFKFVVADIDDQSETYSVAWPETAEQFKKEITRAVSQPPDLSGEWVSTSVHARAASHPPVSGLSGELSCSNGSSMEPDFGDQTKDSSMASSEADEQSHEDEFEDEK